LIELNQLIIGNFKSLNYFKLDFSKFTCFIGLNSSGKSTVLHAIDFISQLMNGDITQWLEDRNWESNELVCKLTENTLITITVSFMFNDDFYIWSFNYNPILKKCTYEEIYKYDKDLKNEELILNIENTKYMIMKNLETKEKLEGDIITEYEGSFLAKFKDELLPEAIKEFKSYLKNIYSLDLLSPSELRKRSKIGSEFGLNGANLSTFLNSFNENQKNELLKKLKKCYKNLDTYNIKKSADGLLRFELEEKFGENKLINEAKYLNDGILRLIAILAQLQSKKSFLLFDEIENGINSELIEFILDTLIESNHQVMITTHSPMILNYIDDEVAKKSVQYIYKTDEGFTQSIPFFDVPSMQEKLDYMGAGEVYVDTNLSKLNEEIKIIEQNKEKEDK